MKIPYVLLITYCPFPKRNGKERIYGNSCSCHSVTQHVRTYLPSVVAPVKTKYRSQNREGRKVGNGTE